MAETDDERTEPGTARKREKAREEGRVARSSELVSMSTTAGILLVLYLIGTSFMQHIKGLTSRMLGLQYGHDPMAVMRSASLEMMMLLAPLFAAAVIFALFSNVLQTGIAIKPLALTFDKLNPLTGLKNLFSAGALPGLVKTVFKFVLGSVVFYIVMKKFIFTLPETAGMDLVNIQSVAFRVVGKTVMYAFSTFFVLALLDYINERWKFERSLRMTKEEIRSESRESEGDPLIKGKIRSMQKEAARRRMMEAVPQATVVITNPTHLAVALRYKKDETSAPKIIAKGKGYVAENIRALARKHGIPLVEDKPLARALIKVPVDSVIPADLYRAVARILAYIYKLRGAA